MLAPGANSYIRHGALRQQRGALYSLIRSSLYRLSVALGMLDYPADLPPSYLANTRP